MKHKTAKSKHRFILEVGLWGMILFGGISLVEVIGNRFWWHGTDLAIGLFLAIPTFIAWYIMGIQQSSQPQFAHTDAFSVMVDGLFGAIIFILIACFLQFIIKDRR